MQIGSRFDVLERVGAGGTSSVFRARDLQRGDDAAVKVLHPELLDDDEVVARFVEEGELLVSFRHPVIPPHRASSAPDDPILWFATDFVDGASLAHPCHSGLSVQDVVVACIEVCDALTYLHRRGIVHRDIKPGNILIDSLSRARLVDFGIARVLELHRTQVGDQLGTPIFVAPEQALDPRHAEPRSDVYSLGITLFAILTRRSGLELQYEHLRADALRALPASLRPLVDRATRLVVEHRYPSAEMFQWDLAAALDHL